MVQNAHPAENASAQVENPEPEQVPERVPVEPERPADIFVADLELAEASASAPAALPAASAPEPEVIEPEPAPASEFEQPPIPALDAAPAAETGGEGQPTASGPAAADGAEGVPA